MCVTIKALLQKRGLDGVKRLMEWETHHGEIREPGPTVLVQPLRTEEGRNCNSDRNRKKKRMLQADRDKSPATLPLVKARQEPALRRLSYCSALSPNLQ